MSAETCLPSISLALSASRSCGAVSAMCFAIFASSALNFSLPAAKSVSQLISTSTPTFASSVMYAATAPSAAMRLAFFSALEMPFSRSQSMAAFASPFVAVSAFLQSIMPAPVFSRSSFTIAAVIAIVFPPCRTFPQKNEARDNIPYPVIGSMPDYSASFAASAAGASSLPSAP